MTNDTTLQRLSTYYGIRCIILLLIIQFINIFFCNGAYAFKGVSIPVWSDEITEEIELTLHKEKLSKYIEIADDEVLKDLKKSEENLPNKKKNGRKRHIFLHCHFWDFLSFNYWYTQ